MLGGLFKQESEGPPVGVRREQQGFALPCQPRLPQYRVHVGPGEAERIVPAFFVAFGG